MVFQQPLSHKIFGWLRLCQQETNNFVVKVHGIDGETTEQITKYFHTDNYEDDSVSPNHDCTALLKGQVPSKYLFIFISPLLCPSQPYSVTCFIFLSIYKALVALPLILLSLLQLLISRWLVPCWLLLHRAYLQQYLQHLASRSSLNMSIQAKAKV